MPAMWRQRQHGSKPSAALRQISRRTLAVKVARPACRLDTTHASDQNATICVTFAVNRKAPCIETVEW